jgi:hypothetical protein
MPIRFRKCIGSGLVRANLSRSGISWTIKLGPWSWNTRSRRHRLDLPGPAYWQGRPRRRRET